MRTTGAFILGLGLCALYPGASCDHRNVKENVSLVNKDFKWSEVSEWEYLNLECPNTKQIYILEAVYGRKTSNCRSNSTFNIVQRRCDRKRRCSIQASNNEFGDPCPFHVKHLWVNYTCNDGVGDYLGFSETLCENERREIKCPNESVIHVDYAFYGRNDTTICIHPRTPTEMCSSENAFDIIKSICHNKKNCILKSENSVFGDPCPYIFKYLKVDYRCVIDRTEMMVHKNAVEGAVFNISCPKGSVIRLKSTIFIESGDEIVEASERCDYKETCSFTTVPELLDSESSSVKYVCEIENRLRVAEIQNHSPSVPISCPRGSSISVYDAYEQPSGRPNVLASSECRSGCARDLVTGKCQQKSSCEISLNVFGIPFFLRGKSVLVEYYCTTVHANYGLACETLPLVMDCPRPYTINVVRADYGRSHPFVCSNQHKYLSPKGCHSSFTNATSIVRRQCQEMTYCSLPAANRVFGDPCIGVLKYLEVTYECVA